MRKIFIALCTMVSVITGNNCLKVLFTKEEYRQRLGGQNNPMGEYILRETDYYFGYNEGDYGIHGFYNWDVIAAVYLVHPELLRLKLHQNQILLI